MTSHRGLDAITIGTQPPQRANRKWLSSKAPRQFIGSHVLYLASSSALCRGSATYQPAADARDKPEHDERGTGPTPSAV
ncbi:hypothetical protein E0H33_04425 [Rhizobium leguminosarum bv. viciae]|nr:hypothetical protein E0H33_04425 [Rhizobium leguminosarum bv. viciae]